MIDEMFIKMVCAATEIQDMWKPKEGDLHVYGDEERVIGLTKVGAVTVLNLEGLKDNLTWCPRIEDLIEMYLKHVKSHYVVPLLAQLVNWADNPQRYHLDLNTMMILFVMETCYNKKWDTNKEKWEMI
ncbi:MAG: hypothetical protein AMQ22_00009 [Candidatus Methanofastidiosum methylothiophilum]|uniref:Uncharacterized protein n=1 Tax=Candidatus Methanofastidiosum methylothiophilum TaxID=1705564 RepID=A0A150J9D2_9EURY|nr:MAG: hypothetical protein AMQ22_00009 [Candidatus Methanofastidiosum methylthiophilus]